MKQEQQLYWEDMVQETMNAWMQKVPSHFSDLDFWRACYFIIVHLFIVYIFHLITFLVADGQQPLHLLLSSNNAKSLEDAKLLAENLLDTICTECGASRYLVYTVIGYGICGQDVSAPKWKFLKLCLLYILVLGMKKHNFLRNSQFLTCDSSWYMTHTFW